MVWTPKDPNHARRGRPGPHVGAAVFTLVLALALSVVVASGRVVVALPALVPARTAEAAVTTEPPVPTPLAELLHSRFYSKTLDPDIEVGQTATVSIIYRNIGLTPWIRGTAAEVRLGEVGPDPLPPSMRVNWPYWDRPARQLEAAVDEHGLATFVFEVRGAIPGVFRLNLRPVVDGVTWLEDDNVHVDIAVREPSDGEEGP